MYQKYRADFTYEELKLPSPDRAASSKMCRHCGTVNAELALAYRGWVCSCGKELDRDINTAINMKNEGCRLLGIA